MFITVNFTISDGESDLYTRTTEFAELYNNPRIRTTDIKKKMGLSPSKYNCLRKYCADNGLIELRQQRRPKKEKMKPTYIYSEWAGKVTYYKVQRKQVYYAMTTSYEDAEAIVQELEKCDWDKSKVKEIKEKLEIK